MKARTGGLVTATLALPIAALLGGCAAGVGTCCREDGKGGHSDCVSRSHRSERSWHRGRSRHTCGEGRVPAAWCPKSCAWVAGPAGTLPSCECSSRARPSRPPSARPSQPARAGATSPSERLLCCASGQTTADGTELFDCEEIDPAVKGSKTRCVEAGKTYKECIEPRCVGGDCVCEE